MMGFFDKVKKAFGSKKEDVKSKSNGDCIVNDENADGTDFIQTTQKQEIELSPNCNILFVCTSNTVISPMAEAIYNNRVTGKKAFSAGLSSISGGSASDNAINVCAAHGIDLSNHHTASLDDMPIGKMDLILTSSGMHKDILKMKYPYSNIFTIKEYAGYSDWDIDDPFGRDLSSYEMCFSEIETAIDKIVEKLSNEGNNAQKERNSINEELELKSIDIPKNILFICQYNDDVSPLAQELFKKLTKDDLNISSAAFGDLWINRDASEDAIEISKRYGMDLSSFTRTEFRFSYIEEKDLILTATANQRNSLKSQYPNLNIFTMKEYAKGDSFNDIEREGIFGGIDNLFIEITDTLLKIIENNRFTLSQEGLDEIKSIYYSGADNADNFNSLENIINSSFDEIILDRDFILEWEENNFHGIDINQNLVIDGNNHYIDAKNRSKIFNINAKEVTFKNIKFLNVHCEEGGLIVEDSNICNFKNCSFEGNTAKKASALYLKEYSSADITDCSFENNGLSVVYICENSSVKIDNTIFKSNYGAIVNNGKLTIDNSLFENNGRLSGGIMYGQSYEGGGAISNFSELFLSKSSFRNNSAWCGGAIHNHASSTINECHFDENMAKYTGGSYVESETPYYGGAIYQENGKLTLNKCHFNSNDASFSGGAIRNESEIILNECEFSSNASRSNGGAIDNHKGKITLNDCTFNNNESKNGGAIINCDKLVLKRSNFANNSSKKGGAIYSENQFTIGNCSFESNRSEEGGSIYNDSSKALINKSDFKNNEADFGSVIYNKNLINIEKCGFIDNNNGPVIYQNGPISSMQIKKSSFAADNSCEIIFVEDGYIEISNSKLDVLNENYWLKNNGTLTVRDLEIPEINKKIICNCNVLKIYKKYMNLVENHPKAIVYILDGNYDEKSGFAFLDELIQRKSNEILFNEDQSGDGNENSACIEIKLDKDILMNVNEVDFYEGGIEISQDGLVLDGQNNIIDASGFSRVFYITAKNVTLKNIKFKNGKYIENPYDTKLNGGAVIECTHNTSLRIVNCEFDNGYSMLSGGAINNNGEELKIIDSAFTNNESNERGVINNNEGHLDLMNCSFTANKSWYGVAIYDCGSSDKEHPTSIVKCSFKDNFTKDWRRENYYSGRGCIYNEVPLNLCESEFIENNASRSGGALFTGSETNIRNTLFESNEAHSGGGAIDNDHGILNLSNCIFKNNKARRGSAIEVNRGTLMSSKCIFENNITGEGRSNQINLISSGECHVEITGTEIRNDIEDESLEEMFLRQSNTDNMSNEKELINLALNDRSWLVRSSAVKNSNLKDKETLIKVSRTDESSDVREIAADKLREISPDLFLDEADIEKIKDENELISIAKNALSPESRKTAVKHIDDEDVLIDIINNDIDSKVKCAAIREIKDQSILKDLAFNLEGTDIKVEAISCLNDSSALKEIVSNDSDNYFRKIAVQNPSLSDKEFLKKVICDDEDVHVRVAAAKNPNQDPSILIDIAVNGERSEYVKTHFGVYLVRSAAISNIEDKDSLIKIINDDLVDEDIKEVAKERLDELK